MIVVELQSPAIAINLFGDVSFCIVSRQRNVISTRIGVDVGAAWIIEERIGNVAFINRGNLIEELQIRQIGKRSISCCLLYTSPSPRDQRGSRMPSSA